MKKILIIILTFGITACAPIQVSYDFDKGTNFSKYKTYNYYSDMKTGLSELDTKRFLEALDAKLESLGITFSETPDFFIDIKSSTFQAVQRNTVGVGLGGGGRNMGGGISIGLPIGQSSANRQITIDFVDENLKQLFWQAVSESSYSPNRIPKEREEQLKAIADKILSQYPPKQ
ncbi:MAG: DUF4136 domain-containing protein [Flavobacteriales bacterium]|nr:DUF4136 domain-containing protein [Flavobacteriia bacterium]NCP05428.1 DUF4136 domain-containing protein [Flavobacteriales bacterium]PIV94778.1 MAG: DUF4136 domain-containing protein [Flavobacteriaceae bacterium CG17_big_fil_post_rev_8_21_14_2_50_33_15]PIY12257.1 MAG: DUF4136 domain-containing protein [Flavobacteriaceae bacterium CG_4_10_14_3_um_filter_33_47]PJB16504.1 MAG: DUF4136 domain-containing protein [Flavobacteriaceae bacterium CG_4_9_14_3_um_filter_33_16]